MQKKLLKLKHKYQNK